jgi:hypothetical protein
VRALTDLYAEIYQVEPARVRDAAWRRAMLYSDRWVDAARAPGSPLLQEVEAELTRSYVALAAVTPEPALQAAVA